MVSRRSSVLIAEDDELIRSIFVDLITSAGYDAVEAVNGRQALEIMSGLDIDLVISDIKMPQMDGLTLLKSIKAKSPQLPVIIITGFNSEYCEEDALAAGADAYITKPFKVDDVTSTLKQVHKRSRSKSHRSGR